MLPPYEIKAKEFTHVLRGYAVEEVDEYCAFALDKYTELYRENDALEQKIASLEAELAHFREDEESIRSALVDAKRASTRIVEEATERSKVILHSAKLNCDRILSEFRSAVSEERDELLLLRIKFRVQRFERCLQKPVARVIDKVRLIAGVSRFQMRKQLVIGRSASGKSSQKLQILLVLQHQQRKHACDGVVFERAEHARIRVFRRIQQVPVQLLLCEQHGVTVVGVCAAGMNKVQIWRERVQIFQHIAASSQSIFLMCIVRPSPALVKRRGTLYNHYQIFIDPRMFLHINLV